MLSYTASVAILMASDWKENLVRKHDFTESSTLILDPLQQ